MAFGSGFGTFPASPIGLPRIKTGESLLFQDIALQAITVVGVARIEYDDGTDDYLTLRGATTAISPTLESTSFQGQAVKDGVIANLAVLTPNTGLVMGSVWAQVLIVSGPGQAAISARSIIAADYIYDGNWLTLGNVQRRQYNQGYAVEWAALPALDSGNIAGNAVIAIPSVAPSTRTIYEVWGFKYSYKCDATVATRTPAAVKLQGLLGAVQLLVNSSSDYIGATLLSLTASQDGTTFLESGGVEGKNQNGTITYATSKFWLPFLVDGTILGATVAAAGAGVAGDVHRLIIYGRVVVT